MNLTRSEAAKLRHAVARIDHWLELATPDDLAGGLSWYERAHAMAESIAEATGLTTRQCAGVIAALSPRCQWASNVSGARRMAHAAALGLPMPRCAGTMSNRRKAWAIARGADPDEVLSGPKVRAFFANIMGDEDEVTVDVWTAEAAEGRRLPQAPARRRYLLLAESYRRSARRRGMCPRDVQAAVWTVYRRTNGHAYDPPAIAG
jgi:hypothetical protein